jgi:ribosomal protein L24E
MSDSIEPATTNRASCRFCKEKIEKGELRFGERVPSSFGEGEQTLWFHLRCAAERVPEKLGVALETFGGEVPERERLLAAVENGKENPKLSSVQRVDRAPTGRARCQQCHEAIEKGALRVGVDRDVEGMMPTVSYLHLRCAAAYLGAAGLESNRAALRAELGAS